MKKVLVVLFVLLFVAVSTNAQKMGAGVQAGVALPMGDFGEVVDMGFGRQGNFMYNLNDNLSLTGSVGYYTWSGKEDIAWGDYSFSSIPILFGARYYFGKEGFKPYGLAEVGIHMGSVSYTTEEISYGGFVVVPGGEYSDSSSDLGFGFGAGFLMPLGKMNLDVTAKYNVITTEGSSSSYVSVLAGLHFPIN